MKNKMKIILSTQLLEERIAPWGLHSDPSKK